MRGRRSGPLTQTLLLGLALDFGLVSEVVSETDQWGVVTDGFGSAVIGLVGNPAGGPGPGQTNGQLAIQWIFQATQAPSANVQCATIETTNIAANNSNTSQVAMPVAVATNAAQVLTIATQWATAGAGTNTIGLNQLIVEALN